MKTIYRLSWEMISPHRSLEFEAGIFTYDDIPEEWWYRVQKEDAFPMDQYNTLKEWAATKEQPIRNVKLEKAVTPEIEWEEVNG